jgi:hypothetical protein
MVLEATMIVYVAWIFLRTALMFLIGWTTVKVAEMEIIRKHRNRLQCMETSLTAGQTFKMGGSIQSR